MPVCVCVQHNEGIIHRDVKPEHVLFNSEKVAKLSGFFLSQVMAHKCQHMWPIIGDYEQAHNLAEAAWIQPKGLMTSG